MLHACFRYTISHNNIALDDDDYARINYDDYDNNDKDDNP